MLFRTLLVFFTLLTFNSLFSQKCRVEDDPFSDERVVSFNYKNKTVFLESKNNEVRLDIEFYYWGEKSYVFEKGASLFLKLENKKNTRTSIFK